MDEIYMDPDAVTKIADNFATMGEVLNGVSSALETSMSLLRATALIGMVGGLALERFLAMIKPQVDHMARFCEEVSQDVRTAVKNYVEQDFTNAGRFG